MQYSILFFIEIVTLFLLSQLMSKMLSSFFMRITHSVKTTIHLLSFFFLPGVMIHELSHWFMASIVFVRTGDIEFWPQIHGDVVKLGSVAVEKTDPIRRTLIGVAPIIFGIIILLVLFSSFSSQIPAVNWQTLLLIYFSFEIGNTMFSSKKDLEGTLIFLFSLMFLIALLYILKIPVHQYVITFLSTEKISAFVKKLNIVLFIPLTVDVIACVIAGMFRQKTRFL